MAPPRPKARPLRRAPIFERIRAISRLALYVAVVCSVIAFFALRRAYADVGQSALMIGRELSQFEDLLGKSHALMLNGERLYVASAMTDQPVSEVLDRFETACAKSGNGLAEEMAKVPENIREDVLAQVKAYDDDPSTIGVLREESDTDGAVACLVQPPEQQGVPLADRLNQFATQGDLALVGYLRYAYAKRTKAGRTHVVTSWTDRSFQVFSLVPMDGEPPGTDPKNAVRPKESLRLLSAEIEGAPHAVRIYDSKASQADILKQFDESMPDKGWERLPFVHEEAPEARAYSREGVDLLVFAYENGSGSLISMVETSSSSN